MTAPIRPRPRPRPVSVASLLMSGAYDADDPMFLMRHFARPDVSGVSVQPPSGPQGPAPATIGAPRTRTMLDVVAQQRAARAERTRNVLGALLPIPEMAEPAIGATQLLAMLGGGQDVANLVRAVNEGDTPGGLEASLMTALAATPVGMPRRSTKAVRKLINQLTTDLAEKGFAGATLDPRTLRPIRHTGYLVGSTSKPIGPELTEAALEKAIGRTSKTNPNLGIWYDTQRKVWYAEPSTVTSDLDEAVRLGARRNQTAIGSMKNGRYAGDITVLRHRSPQASTMKVLDPKFTGTGPVSGAERGAGGAPGIHYYVAPGQPEDAFRDYDEVYSYIKSEELADLGDPKVQAIVRRHAGNPAARDRALQRAGYRGFIEAAPEDATDYARIARVFESRPAIQPRAPRRDSQAARITAAESAMVRDRGDVLSFSPEGVVSQLREAGVDPAIVTQIEKELKQFGVADRRPGWGGGVEATAGRDRMSSPGVLYRARELAEKGVPAPTKEIVVEAFEELSAPVARRQLSAPAISSTSRTTSSLLERARPSEVANLSKAGLRSVEELASTPGLLPTTGELVAATQAGADVVGGYADNARVIRQVFGDDAPIFGRVTAALSPKHLWKTAKREPNLEAAVDFMKEWESLGRPRVDAKTLQKMRRSINARRVAAGQPKLNVMPGTHFGNLTRAFNDPPGELLSGPKADSFWRNLLGDLDPGTLDTRMAQAFQWDQALVKGLPRNVGGRKTAVAGPGYVLGNALLGDVSSVLGIPRAEVQEGIWKAVGDAALQHHVGAAAMQPKQLRALGSARPFHGILGQTPGPVGRDLGTPDPAAFNLFLNRLRRVGEGDVFAGLAGLGILPFAATQREGQ